METLQVITNTYARETLVKQSLKISHRDDYKRFIHAVNNHHKIINKLQLEAMPTISRQINALLKHDDDGSELERRLKIIKNTTGIEWLHLSTSKNDTMIEGSELAKEYKEYFKAIDKIKNTMQSHREKKKQTNKIVVMAKNRGVNLNTKDNRIIRARLECGEFWGKQIKLN